MRRSDEEAANHQKHPAALRIIAISTIGMVRSQAVVGCRCFRCPYLRQFGEHVLRGSFTARDPNRTKRQLIWLLVPIERMSVGQWMGVS
jgi:hypothetical protein